MYQKLNDKIPIESNHAMSELVPQALGHLTDEGHFFSDDSGFPKIHKSV